MWQRAIALGGGGSPLVMDNITLPSTAGSANTDITVAFEPDFVLAYINCSSTNKIYQVYIKDTTICEFQFYGTQYYASQSAGITVSGNVITINAMSSGMANADTTLIYGKV